MQKRESFNVFLSVIKALFLRELDIRFLSAKLGIFWTFFEPFLQIIIYILVKVLLFGRSASDIDYAVFLALNFIAFNFFKHSVRRSITVLKSNKSLFIYRQIKPIDLIISKVLVELFVTFIIILVFIAIGIYFNFNLEVKDLSGVFVGFILLIAFTFASSLFLAMLNLFVDGINKIIGFVLTALMFGSAVFYSINMLPQKVQSILLINPLTHIMEIIHGFFFYRLNDNYVNYAYIIIWTLGLLYVSLWFYEKIEKRIISS